MNNQPEPTEDDDDDPWLRQFMHGAERREARGNATGWGCAIFLGLGIVLFLLALIPH